MQGIYGKRDDMTGVQRAYDIATPDIPPATKPTPSHNAELIPTD
jgi:hypothetical protein